jgi:hypothetical protein
MLATRPEQLYIAVVPLGDYLISPFVLPVGLVRKYYDLKRNQPLVVQNGFCTCFPSLLTSIPNIQIWKCEVSDCVEAEREYDLSYVNSFFLSEYRDEFAEIASANKEFFTSTERIPHTSKVMFSYYCEQILIYERIL